MENWLNALTFLFQVFNLLRVFEQFGCREDPLNIIPVCSRGFEIALDHFVVAARLVEADRHEHECPDEHDHCLQQLPTFDTALLLKAMGGGWPNVPCLHGVGVDHSGEAAGHCEDACDGQQDEDGHVDGGVTLDLRRLRYEQRAGVQVSLHVEFSSLLKSF